MYLKNQVFLVLGISKSGFSVSNFLLDNNVKTFIYEEKEGEKIDNAINFILNKGAIRLDKSNVFSELDNIDVLIISPGVPINHEVCVEAKNKNVRIMGELEFSFSVFYPTIVAITGTNGKTTTVSILDSIFKAFNLDYKTVGNIGNPVSNEIENSNRNTVFLTEVSSFQLESISHFTPHIACILNISPDHLERHYNFSNYVFLKKRIYKNQRESEYTVLNYDDEILKEVENETKGKVVFISTKEIVDGGYLSGNDLYFKNEKIMSADELTIKGIHNVYNVLFAIAVSKLLGIPTEIIREGIKSFRGVKHRIELVLEKDGIKYYNDSKSTNTFSCITAIESMVGSTVLILGGSEKGEDYKSLFEKIKISDIKHVVITGASKYNMLKDCMSVGYDNITVTEDFYEGVKIACKIAKSGENVLFSPACASFDKFNNYEERGEEFVKTVKELN